MVSHQSSFKSAKMTVANVLYNPDKEGFLYKLGGKIKGWKRRWIVLTEKVCSKNLFSGVDIDISDAVLLRRSKRSRAKRHHSFKQRPSPQVRRKRQELLLRAVQRARTSNDDYQGTF